MSLVPGWLNRPPLRLTLRALLAVRRALQAAADAVVPSQLALFEQAVGVTRTQLLHAAARLRLPDLLAGPPRSATELARATGCDPDALFRALRGLAAMGVLRLRRDGRFENGRLARAFRSGLAGSMRDYLDYLGSPAHLAAWAQLDGSLESGGGAFPRVHGMSVWRWLALHPDEERTFAGAMVGLTELQAPAVAAGYPFGELGSVCDVGGGHGTLLAEVLRRYPRLRGVLFDAPQVVAAAEGLLAARGVAGRVERVGGDLLEAVPAGCDAYLLKDVLHDWDDATAVRVLRACRRAARPGGRVLVVEMLLDGPRAASMSAMVDLEMMVVTEGGRQRSVSDHQRLMVRAGLRPGRAVALLGPLGLVEGIAVGRPPRRVRGRQRRAVGLQ